MFLTNNSEKMRIDSSGRVMIGTTTEGYGTNAELFTIANTASTSSNAGMTIRSGTAGQSSIYFSDATSGGGEYQSSIWHDHNANTFTVRTADTLAIQAGGSERMRIDTSGNVGISTTSPETNLHVNGNAAFKSGSNYTAYFAGGGAATLYHNGTQSLQTATSGGVNISGNCGIGTTSPTGKLDVEDTTGSLSSTQDVTAEFMRADGTYNPRLQIRHSTAGTDIHHTYSSSAANLTFSNGGVERMRIDSSGNIRLANSTMNIDNSGNSATGLSVTSSGLIHNATADNVTNMVIQKISGSGTETAITFLYGSSGVGTIQYTSSATSFNTSSDYRLKENIVTDWDATTRLKQLKPSRFNFKVDKDTIVDGFLAHEVQAIVPEAVTGTKDEVDENGDAVMQGIDQSKLVPLLVKTIQELEARIAKLEG
jgi:hypothetical protein